MAMRTLLGGVAITVLACSMASAITIQTIPPGLPAGSEYRLAILTDTTTTGTSSAISYYDTVVADDIAAVPALAALPTTWSAMVSTTTGAGSTATHVIVRDHIVVSGDSSVPIYDLNGGLVATNRSCLFSLGPCYPNPEPGAIAYTPTGVDWTAGAFVWTGSHPNGNKSFNRALGDPLEPTAAVGHTGPTLTGSNRWLTNFGYYAGGYYQFATKTNSLPLYGISGILTVPEPSTLPLIIFGSLTLLRRRRHPGI